MKVAPLGWTLTHESGDGMVAIYRPANVSESGNVSLRIDNTAFSGWSGATYIAYLAKAQLVEDVVDINTFTTIYEGRWPATKRYSDGRWDLIGDSQLFFFLPAYANTNHQALLLFGYINSVRPGDRYHAILSTYPTTNANDSTRRWDSAALSASYSAVYNNLLAFDDTNHRIMARAYHQIYGTTGWWLKGLFARFGSPTGRITGSMCVRIPSWCWRPTTTCGVTSPDSWCPTPTYPYGVVKTLATCLHYPARSCGLSKPPTTIMAIAMAPP